LAHAGQTQKSAREIIEVMLKTTADAMLAQDFDALNACFQTPFVVETENAKIVVDSVETHRALFERIIEGYQSKGVTDIIRVCESAEFITHTTILSLHISHVMAGDHRVEDPMPTLATTELIDGAWRITSAQYVADSTLPVGRAIALQANATD
jgi:hypothetical protein